MQFAVDIVSLMTDTTQGKAMQLPATGWAAIPYNGGVNSREIENFTNWLDALEHNFEWSQNGLLFRDLETGELRSAALNEWVCQLVDDEGAEVILVLDQRQFDLLFAIPA